MQDDSVEKVMTRERVWRAAKALGLEAEVERILVLAEKILHLQPVQKTPTTISYRLVLGSQAATTVFRIGPDYEGSGQTGVTFPFYTWPVPRNRVLEALRWELLANLTRLDKGGAEQDVRVAIEKETIDEILAAICTVYAEMRRELRLGSR
jgi:hypothetical protein